MDIALFYQGKNPIFDIQMNGPDLATNHDLQTAVIISLYTDRLALPDDDYDGNDRKGFWGDSYPIVPGSLMGSRLWLLQRQKLTQEIANQAREYCLEALQWLIDDKVASAITVETQIENLYTLGIGVDIFKPTGAIENFKFSYVWSQF